MNTEQIERINKLEAITKIQAHIRGFLVRKIIAVEIEGRRLKVPIIKYFLPESNHQIEIIGNFSDPKWKIPIKMKFSPIRKLYFTDFLIKQKEQLSQKVILKFNFLLDGKPQISANYQAQKGKTRTYNTVQLQQPKKKSISKLSSKRLKRKWPENQYKKIANLADKEEISATLSHGNSPQRLSQSPMIFSRNQSQAQLILQSHGCMLPNPNTHCEDPAMSCDFMYIGNLVCGVADGLLQASASQLELILQEKKEESCEELILQALKFGYESVTFPGSSTIIIYFIQKAALYISYIGDSQLMILRPLINQDDEINGFAVIYKTKPNCYSFNSPCQLIKWPDMNFVKMLEPNQSRKMQALIQASQEGNDTKPENAINCKVTIKEGDLIICGSDGFFDNLNEQEIKDLVFQEHQNGTEILSQKLTRQGWENSCDEYYESPFQKEAMKNNKMYYGGKPDDCTVVVSKVVKTNNSYLNG